MGVWASPFDFATPKLKLQEKDAGRKHDQRSLGEAIRLVAVDLQVVLVRHHQPTYRRREARTRDLVTAKAAR
jgi:hypothetical protein